MGKKFNKIKDSNSDHKVGKDFEPNVRKKFHEKDLIRIQPKTQTQSDLFDSYLTNDFKNFFLYGSAGTGKTFAALFLALRDVLSQESFYDKIVIVRSTVAVRDIGFLPGDMEEKIAVYEEPYKAICDELFPFSKSYENLKKAGKIEFVPTSFIRGTTFSNAIVIFDEFQNATYQELDSVITRVGSFSKIIFSGDIKQSDLLNKRGETSGFPEFLKVIKRMGSKYFEMFEFTHDDIVRSELVKAYIIAKDETSQ